MSERTPAAEETQRWGYRDPRGRPVPYDGSSPVTWRLGAYVVAERDGRVLMIESLPSGRWELPGGGVELEETLPEKAALMEQTAAINLVAPGAPPAYLTYSQENVPTTAETPEGAGIHHPTFGYLLKEKMDALGLECVVRCGVTPPGAPDEIDWLLRHLR
jgi:NUDIX domain